MKIILFICSFLILLIDGHTENKKKGPFSQLENVYLDLAKDKIHYLANDNTFAEGSLWANTLQIQDGGSRLAPFADASRWEGTTLILADCCTSFLVHYFHFLEHLLGVWEFGGCENRESIKQIIFCPGDQLDDFPWQGVNAINDKLIKALFPHARVFTLGGLKKSGLKSIFMRQAILSSRLETFVDPECTKLNKMLGSTWQDISLEKMAKLKSTILSFYQIPVTENTSPFLRVTYLKRPPPRRLTPAAEEALLNRIRYLPTQLKIVDLAAISYEEQLKIIANTDILISVHGNGLSHIPFLPQDATVIEIFPPNTFMWDYCMFARIGRIDYWGTNAPNWWITSETPFSFPAFGNVGSPISSYDLPAILEIIDKKSRRLDPSRSRLKKIRRLK